MTMTAEILEPDPPITERPVKVCTCCGRQFSAEAWALLPIVGEGIWRFEEGPDLDCRLCNGCTSSIAIEVRQ